METFGTNDQSSIKLGHECLEVKLTHAHYPRALRAGDTGPSCWHLFLTERLVTSARAPYLAREWLENPVRHCENQ